MTDESVASPATDEVIDTAIPATGGGKSEIAGQLKSALDGDVKPIDSGSKRDQLRNQIDAELSKVTEAEKVAKADAQPDAQGRVRGPDGKFVAKEAVETPVEPADPNAAPVAKVETTDAPPAAWKKDIQAKWSELPDWARAEITKREQDVEKGFAKYQNLRSVEPVLDTVSQLAPQYGMTTPQVVQSWANTQMALMNQATAPAEFARLAQAYLKPETLVMMARQILNGQPEPQTQQQPAADPNAWVDPELAGLKQQIEQLSNWKLSREQQEQQAAQREIQNQHLSKVSAIEKFASETGSDGQPLRPHLDTVMPDMVASINRIRATNPQLSDQDVLQQAYENAVWSNPDTRSKVMEAQRLVEEKERNAEARKRAQAASRQAVSPASASPQGAPAPAPLKGNIRDQMLQTFNEITA